MWNHSTAITSMSLGASGGNLLSSLLGPVGPTTPLGGALGQSSQLLIQTQLAAPSIQTALQLKQTPITFIFNIFTWSHPLEKCQKYFSIWSFSWTTIYFCDSIYTWLQLLHYLVACDHLCQLGYETALVEEALEMFQNCEAKVKHT